MKEGRKEGRKEVCYSAVDAGPSHTMALRRGRSELSSDLIGPLSSPCAPCVQYVWMHADRYMSMHTHTHLLACHKQANNARLV